MIALLFVLPLLVSAQYRAVFFNADCSGSPVAWDSYSLGVCVAGAGTVTCNSTHMIFTDYSEAGCMGTPTISQVQPVACTNGVQAFCSAKAPGAPKGAIVENIYGAGCGGNSAQSVILMNTCVPDDSRQSSNMYSINTTVNAVSDQYWNNADCSGTAANAGYPGFSPLHTSNSVTITSSAMTISGQAGFYQYGADDVTCTSGVTGGYSAQTGACFQNSGVPSMATCSGSIVVLSTFDSFDFACKGTGKPAMNLTKDTCVAGRKAFCGEAFNVPAQSLLVTTTSDSKCGSSNVLFSSFVVLGKCTSSQDMQSSTWTTYNATTGMYTTVNYNGANCTGTPSNTDGPNVAGVSLTFSAAPATTFSLTVLFFALIFSIVLIH